MSFTIVSTSPVLGQVIVQHNTGMGASCFIPGPSNNPADLSGLVTQPCEPTEAFPPLSDLSAPSFGAPLPSFPPSTSIMPDLSTLNGLNDLSLGSTLPYSMSAIQSAPLLPPVSTPTSPVLSPDPSSSTPVTIYACVDPASGNIPVSSLGTSSSTGCTFQTVPIVIMTDGTSNTVSACFIAVDSLTPTSNCILLTPPLQQQSQQLTAPFTLPFQ
jgi:hypothetical protein